MRKVSEFPDCDSKDPIARMRVYQLAFKLRPACLEDARTIQQNPMMERIAGQLYGAVGSIPANLAEGYSRSSGRDRSRLFEYSLGSARESIEWYESSKHLLESEIFADRMNVLNEMVRLLLAIIPEERGRVIRPMK